MFGIRTRASVDAGFRLLKMVLLIGVLGVQPVVATQRLIVINNDRGGAVDTRVSRIKAYRNQGVHLEIRGQYCLSACTLYLGLPNICVTGDTVFGFHGPSSGQYGIGLTPAAFDHWSRIMADHYPSQIKDWYLRVGRNRTMGFHTFRGTDLIGMGIAECDDRRSARS